MGLASRIVPPRSPHSFARLYAREIRRRYNPPQIRYDPEAFSIDWGERTSMLRNAYEDYLRVPFWRRKAVVAQYVAAFDDAQGLPESFEGAKPNLLPRLMERFSIEHMRLLSRLGVMQVEGVPVARNLAPERVMAVVVDSPMSVQYLNQGTLDEWGKTLEDLVPTAIENLWAQSKKNFLSPHPGVWMSPYGDTHDASRMILHDLIWQLEVSGEHVALTPNRDTLIVTGSEDAEGLLAALAIAEKVLREEGRPMDARLFRLDGRTWLPWLPPEGSAAHAKAVEMLILAQAREYAEQGAVLHHLHEKEGKDIFVAAYQPFQFQGGRVSAWSIWSEAIPTLLPRSPLIILNRVVDGKPAQAGRYRWSDAERVCGGLMQPQGLCPERYLVERFPDEAMIRALGDSE